MEKSNVVVTKKKSTFWTVVGILLAVAAVCVVAAKVYRKFFKKKQTEELAPEADEAVLLDEPNEADDAAADADCDALEVPADAVIANAEDME